MTENYINSHFWEALEDILNNSSVVIDRPRGSAHPKFPEFIYPVDYGFLEGTSSMDGGEIDVWKGTGTNGFDAILCVVDGFKKDSEIKILLNCTPEEKRKVLGCQNEKMMKAMMINRDGTLS
jgi:inorganic pyrophosphatase